MAIEKPPTNDHLIFYHWKSDVRNRVAQSRTAGRLRVRPIHTTFSYHHGFVGVGSKNLAATEDG
jgi:hypothetical protein